MPSKTRYISINVQDPVFDAFARWAATAYPDRPLADAHREACLDMMGTDPDEAARAAARRSAWLITRIEVSRLVGRALRDASLLLQQNVDVAESELDEIKRGNQ